MTTEGRRGEPAASADTSGAESGKRRALLVALGVAIAVLLIGLAVLRQFGDDASGGSSGSSASSGSGTGSAYGLPATRLEVPSLDIVAGISTITMSRNRVLDPPSNVHAVGRWDKSADFGSDSGRTLLAGHTVYNGGGALGPLPKLEEGELLRVVTPEGRFTYRAVEVMIRSKAWVRRNGTDIFKQPGGDGSLVVVTCTDYNGKDYRSNVIVVAEPVSDKPA